MMSEALKAQIIVLKRDGLGYVEISQSIGVSANAVRMFLLRHEERYKNRCRVCEREIKQVPHRKTKVFCSDKCRMQWWNGHPQTVKKKTFYNFVCPYCGKEFSAYGNSKRKYCSRECFAKVRVKNDN